MYAEPLVTSSTAQTVPHIIYGTAWKQEATAGLVEQALEVGFRGIDTACQPKHYHEAGVGDGIAAAINRGLLTRNQLYLQSKFTPLNGQDPQRIPYDPTAELGQQVEQSFQTSLANLKTDYLDCLVLHSPLADRSQLLTVWRAMEALCLQGGVRQLGISNCYDPALLAFLHGRSEIKPAVVQNRFYADTGYDREIRAFCLDHDMSYQSFWSLTANPGVLASAEIKKLAAKYRRSPAQVFFRYLHQIGIVPLTGTTSMQHMREDLAMLEFQLSLVEQGELNGLF
jgi:diketogulonate reductase-like aldo/keto reductase